MVRLLIAFFGMLAGIVLCLPVLVVALPFGVVARLTRSAARWMEPRYRVWSELTEFDPWFGWRPKPNQNTYHKADDVYQTTTDGQGWRGRTTVAESEVIVLGDSFAFGHGIDDAHFFADLLSEPRIKAIGLNGYSMVHEYLWMQRLSAELQGKLVVWLVYYGNDLIDNLSPDMRGYRAPFLRDGTGIGRWEIVSGHLARESWPIVSQQRLRGDHYHERLAELCTPGFLSQRAYAASEFLLRHGRDLCLQSGARLAVVGIPDTTQLSARGHRFLVSQLGNGDRFDPDYPDKRLRAICKQLDVPFLTVKDHMDLSHFKKSDCHWNEKGHRRMAEILAELHERLGTGKPHVS